jgi:hypothetical protein
MKIKEGLGRLGVVSRVDSLAGLLTNLQFCEKPGLISSAASGKVGIFKE